jgi:peptidyl-tRNA hydrolase
MGADEETVENIDDEDDVKGAAIQLILDMTRAKAAAEAEAARVAAEEKAAAEAEAARVAAEEKAAAEAHATLRAQLTEMKIKMLKRRARELGAEESVIEDLDDEDDVKSATIELIIRMMHVEEGVPPAY